MNSEELKAMQAFALEQQRTGQSLTGKVGAFAPLLKHFLEAAFEAEMNGHLDEQERSKGNKHNGKGSKRVKTIDWEITIETPQDWHSFTPNSSGSGKPHWPTTWCPKSLAFTGCG